MDEEFFKEVKKRVVENQYTREDVLYLVERVEMAEQEMDDLVEYVLEEAELQDNLWDDTGNLF